MELARCREILVDRTPRAASTCRRRAPRTTTSTWAAAYPSGRPRCRGCVRGSAAFQDLASDYRRVHAMLAASHADALARAAATPLGLHQMWLTGLPRHDLVTRHSRPCPLTCARRAVAARAPRRPPPAGAVAAAGSPARTFSDEERDWLAAWCRRHDAVLGVREGAVDRPGSHTQTLARTVPGVSPAATCPTPRWCSASPTRCSPTTPTRLSTSCSPDVRCSTCFRSAPADADTASRSPTIRPRLAAGPGVHVVRGAHRRARDRVRGDGRRSPARLRARRRARVRAHRRPVRVAGWSSGSAASTSTPSRVLNSFWRRASRRWAGRSLDLAHDAAALRPST